MLSPVKLKLTININIQTCDNVTNAQFIHAAVRDAN